MLSRIGLERLCLVLVAVMTAEVGYLWRAYTTPVQRQVVVLEPVPEVTPAPGPSIALGPTAPAIVPPQARPEPPSAPRPRRGDHAGRPEAATVPWPDALNDCARSNDPLCGLPTR